MENFATSLRRELIRILPPGVVNDLSCFSFYDNHPAYDYNIEICVCTQKNELFEFYKRLPKRSIFINVIAKDLTLYRNNLGHLHYLVLSDRGLTVVAAYKEELEIINTLKVDRFTIEDRNASGNFKILVWTDDNLIPEVLNEKFEIDEELQFDESNERDYSEIIYNTLKVKFNEAVYNADCNKEKYKELIKLRHAATHSVMQKMYPNVGMDSTCALMLDKTKPWFKIFNGNLIIGIEIINSSQNVIEDIRIIIDKNSTQTIEYKTNLFKPINTPPFWILETKNRLQRGEKASLLVTSLLGSALDEIFKYNCVVFYKVRNELKFVALESFELTSLEIVREEFDLFGKIDEVKLVACLMSLLKSTKLTITPLSKMEPYDLTLVLQSKMFYDKLLFNDCNILVHRRSPHNVLFSSMVVINFLEANNVTSVTVFTRDNTQLMHIIRSINNTIPQRLIITSADLKVKIPENMQESMDIDTLLCSNENPDSKLKINEPVSQFGESLCRQMGLLLSFFDECMMMMGASKSQDIINMIGEKIDLSIVGQEEFNRFLEQLRKEIQSGSYILSQFGKSQ